MYTRRKLSTVPYGEVQFLLQLWRNDGSQRSQRCVCLVFILPLPMRRKIRQLIENSMAKTRLYRVYATYDGATLDFCSLYMWSEYGALVMFLILVNGRRSIISFLSVTVF